MSDRDRGGRLRVAQLLAGVLLVAGLAGTAAPAAPAEAASRRPLTLSLSSTEVTSGDPVLVKGALGRTPIGAEVRLERYLNGAWRLYATTSTTTVRGAWGVRIRPTGYGSWSLRARAVGTDGLAEARSRTVRLDVYRATTASLQASSTRPDRGDVVRFSGSVTPVATGAPVRLQWSDGDAFRDVPNLGATTVSAAGKFAFRTSPRTGVWRYRAVVGRSGRAFTDGSVSRAVTTTTAGPASVVVQLLHVPEGTTPEVVITDPTGATREVGATTTIPRAAAGAWRVQGMPLQVGDRTFWPTVPTQDALVARSQSVSLVVDYSVVLTTSTAVIPEEAEVEAEPTEDPDVVQVTIQPTAEAAASRVSARSAGVSRVAARTMFGTCPVHQQGQYVAVGVVKGMPTGAIGTVQGEPRCLDSGAQMFYLDTTPAARPQINQLVQSGSIDADFRRLVIGAADALTNVADGVGKVIKGTHITARNAKAPKPVAAKKAGLLECQDGGEATVEFGGDLTLSPEITIDPKLSGFGVESISVTTGLRQTGEVYVEASGTCEKSFDQEIWSTHLAPFQVQLGPVPIVIAPEIDLRAKGSVKAAATGRASISQESFFGGRVRWTAATGQGTLENATDIKSLEAEATLDGSIDAQVALRAELTFKLYGVGGPSLYAEPSLNFEGRTSVGTGGASISWKLYPKLVAGTRLRAELFGYTVQTDDFELFSRSFDPLFEGDWSTGHPECRGQAELPSAECNALMDLTTENAGWQRADWGASATPCSWTGVTCENGHVTQLEIFRAGVTTVPSSFGDLVHLETLSLGANNVKMLPESLGRLGQLRYLDLSSTGLIALPESIGQLRGLEQLYLRESSHLTTIPESFGDLTNLVFLDMRGAYGRGPLPASMKNLTKLQHLDLSYNDGYLTTVPGWIRNLTNLTTLYLGSNGLADVPVWIGDLTKLRYLALNWTNIVGDISSWAKPLSLNARQMERLYLTNYRCKNTGGDEELTAWLNEKSPGWTGDCW